MYNFIRLEVYCLLQGGLKVAEVRGLSTLGDWCFFSLEVYLAKNPGTFCLYWDYLTWTSREVTLPGLCPSGLWELRALPGEVQSLSTTLEMKLGFQSAPAYSYDFSESCGQ